MQAEMQSAAFTVRLGARFVRRLLHMSMWSPVVMAVIFWGLYGGLSSTGQTMAASQPQVVLHRVICSGVIPECHLTSDGSGAPLGLGLDGKPIDLTSTTDLRPIGRMLQYLSLWFLLGALITTTGAVFLGAVRLLTGGTSRRGAPGRGTTPAHALHSAGRSGGRGRSGGIRGVVRGVQADHRAAKRDVRKVRRATAKAGTLTMSYWGRRWAKEQADGLEPSDMGPISRRLARHAPPPKHKTKRQKRKVAKEAKADRKAKKSFNRARRRVKHEEVDLPALPETLAAPATPETVELAPVEPLDVDHPLRWVADLQNEEVDA